MKQKNNNNKRFYDGERPTSSDLEYKSASNEEAENALERLVVSKTSHDAVEEEMSGGNMVASDVGERSRSKQDNVSGVENSTYPVTWLPAMVVTTEPHSNNPTYIVEPSGESRSPPNHGMPAGAYFQFPVSYNSGESNSKIIGLVLGSNTVVPFDSISLMNFHPSFSKYGAGGNMGMSDGVGVVENMDSMVKAEGDGSPDSVVPDVSYPNVTVDPSSIKDPLICGICNKWLKTVNEFQTHLMLEHAEQSHLSSYISDTSSMHPSLRTCPSCGHQLRKVGTFDPDYAIASHDDDQTISLAQSSNILMICDNCCKEFTLGPAPDVPTSVISNSNLGNISMNPSHDTPKRHFCDHCEKSYKHHRDLRKHLRTHHNIDCNTQSNQQPSETFATNSSLNQTATSENATQSPKLMCDICKKMFRGPFELRRHIHTVHENKRPYKCPDCSKLFRDAYELKRHSASHQRLHYHSVATTGVPMDSTTSMEMIHLQNVNDSQVASGALLRDVYNPTQTSGGYSAPASAVDYYCTSCEKNFRGANEFKRHYSVVHEKKYRYKCVHCGKLWRDQYDLKRHCRRSHFLDRDIDKAFIRQCLLDNNPDNSVTSQTPVSMTSYDIPQQMTLTLNHEAAAAIFGTSDQDCRDTSNQLDSQFSLVDPADIAMNTRSSLPSPSATMFQSMSGQPAASMLYHQSEDGSHMNATMMETQDMTMRDGNKNTVNWVDFDTNIRHDTASHS